MSLTEIRPITSRAELSNCYDLWERVFPDGREFFQARLDYDTSYDLTTTWGAYIDGELAAAVQIFPYETEICGIRLQVAGIGSVGTHPAFRRRGLAHAILCAQSRWMEAKGFDASLLFTGIPSFYEQVGWRTRQVARFQLEAKALGVQRAKLPASSLDVEFRQFQLQDLPQLMKIYEAWRPYHPGSWMRTEAYWRDALHWLKDETICAVVRGQIVAYARVRSRNKICEIRELCYRADANHVVLPLYANILSQFDSTQVLSVELPTDHELFRQLSCHTGSLVKNPSEMWKVINPARMMRKLQPLLAQRLGNFDTTETWLCLQVEDTAIYLYVHQGHVTVVDSLSHETQYSQVAHLNAAQFMQWLFYGAPTDGDTAEIFKRLFPQQPGMLWNTDHF